MKSIYRVDQASREMRLFTTIGEDEVRLMHDDIKHLVIIKVADKMAEKIMERIMPLLDSILKEVRI